MKRVLLAAALLLVGCGEEEVDANKPDLQEIHDESDWQLETLPDGQEVWCRFFAESGYHRAWLVYTCVPKEETGG